MLAAIKQVHLNAIGLVLFVLLACGLEELNLLREEAKQADVPFGDFLKKIWFKK